MSSYFLAGIGALIWAFVGTAIGAPPPATESKATTSVHGIQVRLLGTGDVRRMKMVTEFDTSRIPMQKSFQQFAHNAPGASVSGAVGGGGGGFGLTFRKPTFGLAFSLSNTNNQGAYVELGSKVKIVDVAGDEWESPNMGPAKHRFPDFEGRFGSTDNVYLYRPSDSRSPIKKIYGELLVTPGRKIVVRFDGARPQTKKAENEVFSIQSVVSNKDGVRIAIRFPQTTASKQVRSPQDRFRAAMLNRAARRAVIEDSTGQLHVPTGTSNVGTDIQSSFTFSRVNGVQSVRGAAGTSPTPTETFTFQPLPNGVDIKAIVVTFVDQTGEPQTVPFELDVQ